MTCVAAFNRERRKMPYYGPSFDWASGFDTFTYASSPPHQCGWGFGIGVMFPPFNYSDPELDLEEVSPLVPSVVVPGASVVAIITKVKDFTGTFTIQRCETNEDVDDMDSVRGWQPQVGSIYVFSGQCVYMSVVPDATSNCSAYIFEVESALIGDFCARYPAPKVCKGHNITATIPPALRLSHGADISGSGAKSGGTSASHRSIHRTLLASLAACLTLVWARVSL